MSTRHPQHQQRVHNHHGRIVADRIEALERDQAIEQAAAELELEAELAAEAELALGDFD